MLFVQLVQFFAQLADGHALVAHNFEVQFVGATSQCETTGFVVGGNDDEGFIGVLLIEFVCHLDGVVHVNYFGDEAQVVGVACPVNLTALHHQEESVLLALLLGEEVYGCAGDVGQGKVVLFAVECIGDASAVLLAGFLALEEDHAVGLLCLLLVFLVSAGNGETFCLGLLIEVGTAVGVLGLDKVRSAIEVVSALHQLLANLV